MLEQPGYQTRGIKGKSQFLELMAGAVRSAYGGVPIKSLAPQIPYPNIGVGYAIQETNTRLWLEQGRQIVGRKVAYASQQIRENSHISDAQTVFGMLFDNVLKSNGAVINSAELTQPQVAAELGFRVAQDVTTIPRDKAAVLKLLDVSMPLLEVSSNRILDENKKIIDVVADNASAGLCVLGEESEIPSLQRIETIEVEILRDGDCVSSHRGSVDVCAALTRLFVKMIAWGRPVRAGDIIASGAFLPSVPGSAGHVYEGRFSGLGSVWARFS